MPSHSNVNADLSRLPEGWQRDPLYREEIYRKVNALHKSGVNQLDIARATGVSARGVGRILHWTPPTSHECGAPLSGPSKVHDETVCHLPVREEGALCVRHR